MSLEVNIQKKYRGFTLDVSFAHAEGTLGILGPSGSGKTMTLQSIAGIVKPDAGRIVLNGRVLFDSAKEIDEKPQKRKVGYLFQNYALFPNMTVQQNIMCSLKKESKDIAKEKTQGLINRFRLNGMEKRYPSQLSGGQQQRVALARILAYEPELLLLDEPFSALDSHLKERLQLELLELLREFSGQALMVTHSRDEAYKLSRKIMIMEKGRAATVADTKEMFENPKLLSAAKLTGCKNFSRIQKVGDSIVQALDWGVTLQTGQHVSQETTHIGIRAHDFMPTADANGQNLFAIQEVERWEAPFEWNVVLKSRDLEAEENEIWWKCSKPDFPAEMPAYFTVAPEKILLLRE